MLFVIFVIFHLSFTKGFLLDNTKAPNNVGQNMETSQCLSLSEFFEYKKQQQQDAVELRRQTDILRAETDKTLALLASQLQQKFAELKVEQNVTQNVLTKPKEYYEELEVNYTKLRQQFDDLVRKYELQGHELQTLNNNTKDLEEKIAALHQLKVIQQLQDVNSLQSHVQTLSAQTHLLTLNQQARNQDFLALYNETLVTKKSLQDLQDNMVSSFQNFTQQQKTTYFSILNEIERRQNETVSLFNGRIISVEQQENLAHRAIEQQIDHINETVALTSCLASDTTLAAGTIILYGSVRTQYGIRDLTSFLSTGIFTCEKSGLYLVSFSTVTNTFNGQIRVYKNGSPVSPQIRISTDDKIDSGTIVIALFLVPGDTVCAKTSVFMFVDMWGTCLTIIKIQ